MNTYFKIKTETIKSFKTYYLLLILIIITSCNKDDDTTTPPQDSINGFWSIAEKGWIFEFKDGNDIFYNVNAAGCSIQNDSFVIEDFFRFTLNQTNKNELIATSELSDSDVILTRLDDQNPSCFPDQLAATEDPVVNFDHFWNIFNDYYVFFEARNIDWSPYESLRDQVTEDNLYETIEQLAYILDDGHVSIYDEEMDIDIQSGDPTLLERLNAHLDDDANLSDLGDQKINTIVTEYLNDEFEIDDRENVLWGVINDTTAYINFLTMQGYGTDFNNEISSLNEVLDNIMNDLEAVGVSKLIIDIRFNGGGFDTVALDMVSRFINEERVSYFKKARLGDGFTENTAFSVAPKGNFQFTDDIVLLTSPFTISAAELFALCIKDLSYVTIVGENTQGAFSTVLEHKLPNGAEIGLSNEIYTDAQGEVFEVVGIGPESPENEIPFFLTEDFEEEKDGGIDRALEILNN